MNKVKVLLSFILLFLSNFIFGQVIDDVQTIECMKSSINQFFVDNGEIDSENKLTTTVFEITDKSELGHKKTGIYIIRTVYRTDGNDYVFFKNDQDYEIISFQKLAPILNRASLLLENESDEVLINYINKIIEWYKGTKRLSRKLKLILGRK